MSEVCGLPVNALVSFYPTRDLAATRHFYEEIMGLELARDQTTCLIFKVADAAYLGFCQHDTSPDHSGIILTLVTGRVDEVYAVLAEQEVELEAAPRLNKRYGIYHFFARDPNNYRVEVQRFLEPLA